MTTRAIAFIASFSGLVIGLGAGGCGAPDAGSATDGDGAGETAQELATSSLKVVGSAEYNVPSPSVSYKGSPKYLAYKFIGAKGDILNIWVHSGDGDAYAYLLNSKFTTLASNNDAAGGGSDSNIQYTLKSSGTYYVGFREAKYKKATLSIEIGGLTAKDFACQTDVDCVAVPMGACCPSGRKAAVAKGHEKDYDTATACESPPQVCPLFLIYDQRVAQCNAGTKVCELVEPGDIACGGFTRNPHHCATGYTCQVNRIPDVPGKCVAN